MAVLLLSSVSLYAQEFEVDGICYNVISSSDYTVEVCRSDYKPEIVIPERVSYEGKIYNVTSIGQSAFCYRGITSVTIPNSVTSIGDCAFEGCGALTSVTIGNSVTSIGRFGFEYCRSLKSLTIPNSVTSIGDRAFYDCSGLTSLTIGSSVTSVGSNAFERCSGLKSVTFRCKYVGGWFSRTGIKEVVFGDSVIGISNNAFSACHFLTSVTIPNSVTKIGNWAFRECDKLTSVSIGDGVTDIDDCAFWGCRGLTSVTIGNSVTSIGREAFKYCGLTSVTIPSSVTSIGYEAFSALTSVTILCKKVGNAWFSGMSTLKEVVLGDSLTEIGERAFGDCSGLTSIKIPNNVISIGHKAFSGCVGFTTITIPNKVTSIGWNAFEGCTGITSVTIPNNVISVGEKAFSGCSSLTSVTIFGKKIGNSCFSGINNLEEVILGEGVTEIGNSAFEGCGSLTSVTIPNSVTSIGYKAFQNCSSLTSVIIGNSVTSISSAFDSCSSLKYVTFHCKNVGGWFSGMNNLKEVILGDSVTSIGSNAFESCSGLTSVTFGNNVTSIGYKAFRGCSSLTSVTIPNSVTSIGERAFQDCSGLTSVVIGNSVKIIEEYAIPHNINLYIKLLATTPPEFKLGYDEDTFGKIEVPKGSACKYALANNWQKSDTIFVLDGKTYLYPIPIIREGDNVVSINGSVDGCEAKEGEEVTIKAYSLTNKPLVMKVTQNVSKILSEKGSFTFKTSIYHSDNVIYTYDFPLTNISLSESGTLIDKVTIDNVLDIENLKISGNINGTDLLLIRKMENLKLLDLGDAHIVEGGMSYYKNYVTSKNRIGNDFFSNNPKLYTVILPQDITEICEHSFFGCSELRTLLIPKTVNKMNGSIFPWCDKLHSIHIMDLSAYCSIGFSEYTWMSKPHDMYLNDIKIVDLVIPDGVTRISSYAFDNLNRLNSLVIPITVTKIGKKAFYCQINNITCLNPTPPEISGSTFTDYTYNNATLYVPKGSKTLYWLHPYWEKFNNIVELDESGINDVKLDVPQMSKGVYTIDGVKVSANADNIESLPKGIYIVNGEKVIIK